MLFPKTNQNFLISQLDESVKSIADVKKLSDIKKEEKHPILI